LDALISPAADFFLGACCALAAFATVAIIWWNSYPLLMHIAKSGFDYTKLGPDKEAHLHYASRFLGPMRMVFMTALGGSVGLFIWGIIDTIRSMPTVFGIR
jgi:hypothetical protein